MRQLLLILLTGVMAVGAFAQEENLQCIVSTIGKLEGQRDPKCYATAARLEDFMYGTPLTHEARRQKNAFQKNFVQRVWSDAGKLLGTNNAVVSAVAIREAAAQLVTVSEQPDGSYVVELGERTHHISKKDYLHYGSVAYSLRAVLAVQQAALLGETTLPRIDESAVEALKKVSDLATLAVLYRADQSARKANAYEVQEAHIVEAAGSWLADASETSLARSKEGVSEHLFKTLSAVINQKLGSYRQYNDAAAELFRRNIQVFFAKHRWPADSEEADELRRAYVESLVQFAKDLYHGSEALALEQGHPVITLDDVHAFAMNFIPHRINEYEDAIFFPRLGKSEQVFIEAYDMDAFRDSGNHWRYLGFAISDKDFPMQLEPDPFAAELMTEQIAQFGVLVLRVAGAISVAEQAETLKMDHFAKGFAEIQKRVNRHAAASEQTLEAGRLVSAEPGSSSESRIRFTRVTEGAGISFMHLSSDWLSRQLRSYLEKGEHLGTATIPPAFGGGGAAAEDVDGDGWVDLLLVGGRGNVLYRNRGDGTFEDITEKAGLDWRRSDGNPGEPRQPLIADLDNDGHQDICITYVDDPHRVYRNRGDGTFEDVTDSSGLGGKGLVGGPATVVDIDGDGLLDMYITYFGNYLEGHLPTLARRNTNALPNRLFKNLGGFRFKDVTAGSGVDNPGWGQAVTHTDLDGDGLQDLIAGNDFGVNAYYRNNGDGTFTDIASELGTDKPTYTMSIGLGDVNQDQRPDIYIANIVTMNKDEKYVQPSDEMTAKFNPDKLGNMRVVEANDLFLSAEKEDGRPAYVHSQLVERGYDMTGWSWDADFGDLDNDGDEDIYVLNGMNDYFVYSKDNPYYTDPFTEEKVPIVLPDAAGDDNVLLVNEDGLFRNRTRGTGLGLVGNSRSAVYFDYDKDGDLDIAVNNYHGDAVLFRNDSAVEGRGVLWVNLTGDPDQGVPLDAIGSRILVETSSGKTLWREVHGSIGYMSVHPKAQHFGLGADQAKKITVIWPNGKRSEVVPVEGQSRVDISLKDAEPIKS